VKVIKNKVAPPFRQAEFDIMNDEGISRAGNVLDIAVNLEIIRKSGAWFYLGEDRLGQGRENAKTFLNENPALMEEIERLIRAQSMTRETAPVAAPNGNGEEDDGLFEE
jgi:recombination protein RecA